MAGVFNLNGFTSQNNQLKQIPVNLLDYNNEYERYKGEQFSDMVESIRNNGVLQPLIVRPNGDGSYTILAGNNRRACGEAAGLTELPCVVKEGLTDEEAQAYIDETNVFQRGFKNLRLSKQAEVIARRHSQMFGEDKLKAIQKEIAVLNGKGSSGADDDEDDDESDEKISKLAMVGREYDLGKTTIARLIRINSLVKGLKSLVDEERISVRAAVEISYCTKAEQNEICNALIKYNCRLEMKKSVQLRGLSGSERFSELLDDIILGTYVEEKESPKEDTRFGGASDGDFSSSGDVPSFAPDLPESSDISETDVIGGYARQETPAYTPSPQPRTRESFNDGVYDNDDEDEDYESDNGARPVTIRLSGDLVAEFFSVDNSEQTILRTIETALRQYFASLK